MDGDYLSAIRYYERCVDLDKEFLLAYPYLLHCFNQTGDMDSAYRVLMNIFANSLNINETILGNQLMTNLYQEKK